MADVFRDHQLRISGRTLELTDEGAAILGGMTKDEARRLLAEEDDRQKGRRRARTEIPEDHGDEEGPACPVCEGGEGYLLGRLGSRVHFRCRDCGIEWSSEGEAT